MMRRLVEARKRLQSKHPELFEGFIDIGYEFIHEKCEPERSFKVIAKIKDREVGKCIVLVHGEYADITFVYVRPEWRCLGIGTNLVKRAIEECKKRGIKTITADVLVWSPTHEVIPEAAKRILEKLGFKHEKYPLHYVLRLE